MSLSLEQFIIQQEITRKLALLNYMGFAFYYKHFPLW